MDIQIALLRKINNKYEIDCVLKERYKDMLYINQYTRDDENNYLEIGVRILNQPIDDNYQVCIETNSKAELVYDAESGYFVQGSQQEVVGISHAGFVKIQILNKNNPGQEYRSEIILIKPAIISWEQYEQMIKLIKNINQELIISDDAYVKMSFQGKEVSKAEYIKQFLENIRLSLQLIDREPATGLVKEYRKVKKEKLRKHTGRLAVEQALYPAKRTYVAEQTMETTDIYENRIIYFSLYRISKRIDLEYESNKKQKEKYERERLEVQRTLNVTTSFEYRQKLNVKLEGITTLINRYHQYHELWIKSKQIIQGYLKYSVFKAFANKQDNKDVLRLTAVFMHDRRYKHIYTKLKEFYANICEEENTIEEGMLSIKEMYEVFEVWTLFEMIRVLVVEQKWEMRVKNFARCVKEYYKRNRSLYGFSVQLEHNVGTINKVQLTLTYNKTLELTDKNLRPDYTFEYEYNSAKARFYLDAKYHNYDAEMSGLFKDIQETAIDKYFNPLYNTPYQANGSYIVHCVVNENAIFWGTEGELRHRIGGFCLLPNKSSYFLTWIGLCMEWFLNQYHVCWACGSTNVQIEVNVTKGGKEKYYYNCNHCKSFWVKTHCYGCKNKLIKHDMPQKQYHKVTSEKWMVYCPICHE